MLTLKETHYSAGRVVQFSLLSSHRPTEKLTIKVRIKTSMSIYLTGRSINGLNEWMIEQTKELNRCSTLRHYDSLVVCVCVFLRLSVYVCVCLCLSVSVFVCLCLSLSLSAYVGIWLCLSLSVFVCVFLYLSVCVYRCLSVSVCVSMCLSMSVSVCFVTSLPLCHLWAFLSASHTSFFSD